MLCLSSFFLTKSQWTSCHNQTSTSETNEPISPWLHNVLLVCNLGTSDKFHFREIDWVLYFSSTGNKTRKYPKYGVSYLNRKKGYTQPGFRIDLINVLNESSIKDNYPHTVSYYRESEGKGADFKPSYIETRTVRNKEDFFKFLSALEI
jgi:hypothetical protein